MQTVCFVFLSRCSEVVKGCSEGLCNALLLCHKEQENGVPDWYKLLWTCCHCSFGAAVNPQKPETLF